MRRYPWVVLAAFIGAYDLYLIRSGSPTLSEAFHRAVRHPVKRWPTVAAWSTVSLHLFGILPERWDPLHRAAAALTPSRRV